MITDMIVLCKKKNPVSNWWFSFPVAIKNDIEKENWRILSNKEIYASVKKPTIIETIRLNRLHWFRHVQRMEGNRIPRRILYMNLWTTRLRGRWRNRWQDEVSEDWRIVGGEGWQEKVHNREEWKKLLRATRDHRILHMPMEWMNEWMNVAIKKGRILWFPCDFFECWYKTSCPIEITHFPIMKHPKLPISSFLDPELYVDTTKSMIIAWHKNQQQSLYMFILILEFFRNSVPRNMANTWNEALREITNKLWKCLLLFTWEAHYSLCFSRYNISLVLKLFFILALGAWLHCLGDWLYPIIRVYKLTDILSFPHCPVCH